MFTLGLINSPTCIKSHSCILTLTNTDFHKLTLFTHILTLTNTHTHMLTLRHCLSKETERDDGVSRACRDPPSHPAGGQCLSETIEPSQD